MMEWESMRILKKKLHGKWGVVQGLMCSRNCFCCKKESKMKFWPMEQSAPVQLASQMQTPESVLKVPWLEHCSGQVLFRMSQLIPPQPGLQWHSPWWQVPWPEHIGSRQSTEDTPARTITTSLPDRLSNHLICLLLQVQTFFMSERNTFNVSRLQMKFAWFEADCSSFCSLPSTSSFTLYYRLLPIYWQHNYALL